MSKEIQCKCCKEYWWENNIHSKSGLCPNCYDYVSDLEVKLAESEKEKDYYQDLYFISIKGQDKLKQQLAEKEKEIEKYRNANMIVVGGRSQGKKHLMQIKIKELQNQTAIAELEKVKWFLVEKIEEKQSCFDSGNYNDFADGVKTICELMLISIDKQIKELCGVENVF